MRPLALAAVLAALVGCSKPYEGTSFAALPKPEHMAEGEHRETNDREVPTGEAEGERQVAIASKMYDGDAFPDVSASHWAYESTGTGAKDRTSFVFPSTAKPTR